jgi:hypothetical protein
MEDRSGSSLMDFLTSKKPMDYIHYPGEYATYDSFTGMIRCIVLDVMEEPISPAVGESKAYITKVLIRITSRNNRIYECSEKLWVNHTQVYPRKGWRYTGRSPFHIVVDPYLWKKRNGQQ